MFDFEKLDVWKDSICLAHNIKKQTKSFPKNELFSLTSQLDRASTSISANIAEGIGRYNHKDRIRFLYISRGSLYETISLLRLSLLEGYIKDGEYAVYCKECNKIAKRLNALIAAFKNRL